MWAVAATPIVWLLLFGLFILRTRVALGRWPAPYQPDPKDLGFVFHYAALMAGMPLMFAAMLTVTAATLFARDRTRRNWLIPIVALTGLTITIALAQIDPGLLFTWLGD